MYINKALEITVILVERIIIQAVWNTFMRNAVARTQQSLKLWGWKVCVCIYILSCIYINSISPSRGPSEAQAYLIHVGLQLCDHGVWCPKAPKYKFGVGFTIDYRLLYVV